MKDTIKWNATKCFNCKYMYYIYDNANNTMFCGKSKAVNQYCSTENYKDKCKKFEYDSEIKTNDSRSN